MTTLLELTQSILSDMSGDSVNSIYDTEESEQVARVIVSTFDAMVSRTTWPQHRRLVTLTPYSDSTAPSHMTITDNIKEMISIYYNTVKFGETKKTYVEMKYKSPDDFLRYVNKRDNTKSNVTTVVDPSGVELFIVNDRAPTFYTSFNDSQIVFDSHDVAVDTTLQESKVQAMAYILPTLALDDAAVPDLPVDAIAALREDATVRAQHKLAEVEDVTSAREARKQKQSISRKAWKTNADRRYPDYGRK